MKQVLKQFEETIDVILSLKHVQDSLLLEPIREGKWSIREIVGHLYYWDKYNLEKMLPEIADGANLPQFPNHDEYNMEAISYLKDKSIDSIINLFIATRKELIRNISNIGENVKFTIGKGKRQLSAESFIKIFLKHDIHHLQQINEKLNK